MIVNQSFAHQFFPCQNVLGKKLKPGAGNGSSDGPPWREIVGVVGTIKLGALDREVHPAMYLPAAQLPAWCCLYSVVRTSLDPSSLANSVQKLVSGMDKDIPVTQVRTMNELMFMQLSQPRFAMILLSSFAGLAIVLTIVGLYGVMTYSVSRRTREIGVRMALGAPRASVLTMILRDAAIPLMSGITLGPCAPRHLVSILQSMLYGANPGPDCHGPCLYRCWNCRAGGRIHPRPPSRLWVDPMVALR
jgi:hypothetical protein